MRRGGGLSDEDKERLGLEEKKARGRTLADVRTSVHLRGVIYTRICRNVCGSGRINPFFLRLMSTWTHARTKRTRPPSLSLSLPVLCCHPVAERAAAGAKAIRFPGNLSPRTVVAKQDIHHHHAPPTPSQRHPPRLMNHHCTFHGVRFILIKRSRVLFFLPLFWAPEMNGVSGMFLPTFLPPAGRRDPGSSSGNWIGRVGLWFISVGGDHRV